jgi:hypothetical protein|nr:MAG TPA: hypothetical protein [Caudoviricetes sp.]
MTMICCENCKHFLFCIPSEEPCLSCLAKDDRIEYWEPIIEEECEDEDEWLY